jgi:hypothetical protein
MFFSYFSNTRELNTVAAKPNPLKTIQKLLCAVGVVTTRREPQSGRISALAGRRAAYERVQTDRSSTHSDEEDSYNIHH